MDEKLHRRARKLAGLTIAPGPEGAGAYRRLQALINDHPHLDYLDVPRPMELQTLYVDAPAGRRHLLTELGRRFEVAVTSCPNGKLRLEGRHADINGTMQWYEALAPKLDRFLGIAATAWLLVTDHLPGQIPATPAAEPIEPQKVAEVPEADETTDEALHEDEIAPPQRVLTMLKNAAKKLRTYKEYDA